MSMWTHINGSIVVDAIGRTQAEKEYILKTIIEHLPIVTGSEEDMNIYYIKSNGYSTSSSADEFGKSTNNLKDQYDKHNRERGWLRTQNKYIIVVDGDFRDRTFDQTFIEFNKWLCRLSKRIFVDDVLVKLAGFHKSYIFTNDNDVYSNMFEYPSWTSSTGEPAWYEYLLWKADDCGLPRLLMYKYYYNENNDRLVGNWIK